MILSLLVEGNSIASTCRITGANKVTVLRLLVDAGTFAEDHHDLNVRDLETERVQVDEQWSYVGCHDRARERGALGHGSKWSWIALDADSKLVISYLVGERDQEHADAFIADTADRIMDRVQVTSDGHPSYPWAMLQAFGRETDFAQLIKQYATDPVTGQEYVSGSEKRVVTGAPDEDHVSTSFVERFNLTMRMGNKRYVRKTNAYSKRIENHACMVALVVWHYNWIRKHDTIKSTPAVKAGLADKALTMEDFVRMLEAEERKLGGRITDYKAAKPSKKS